MKYTNHLYLYFFSLWVLAAQTSKGDCHYTYPISICNNQILTLAQAGQETTLFFYSPESGQYMPALAPWCTPRSIALLPDNKGFSFIDAGLIKIQLFQKRSPTTVLLDLPLYNVTQLHWIDINTFYTYGLYEGRSVIVEIDRNGMITFLKKERSYEYYYPYKIEDQLFYVQYDTESKKSSICSSLYSIDLHSDTQQVLLHFDTGKPRFLFMQSAHEGFFIDALEIQNESGKNRGFAAFRFWQNETCWTYDWLFDFWIPKELLNGKHRLCESLLPLLPMYNDNTIFFFSVGDHTFLSLYSYNVTTKVTDCLLKYNDQHLIGLVLDKKGALCVGCGK